MSNVIDNISFKGNEYNFADIEVREQVNQLSSKLTDLIAQGSFSVPIVDSVDEMTDTTKQYVLKSTGTIWEHKSATIEKEVTITDGIETTGVVEETQYKTDDNYLEGYRLDSSGSSYNAQEGYHITPVIDLTKSEYAGKVIQIHLEGAQYASGETYANFIQCRPFATDRTTVLGNRVYVCEGTNVTNSIYTLCQNISADYISDTSTIVTINMPPLYGFSTPVEIGYLCFCGKGAAADSNIYITYQDTQTITEETWVDTGIPYGSSGGSIDSETLAKISALNNEGVDPTTIKLLSKPVLDFYNADPYSDSDYSTSHLLKITYPCRADIPIPYNVKWEHNENAMRTTVAVDTKAIGTNNRFSMTTFEATGLDSYPLYNLLPNTRYYYKVTHVLADGSLVEAKSGNFTTSNETVRFLYIDGTQNVRDLGGWTGLNGKTVKYGKIIRGASFSDSSYHGLMLTGKGKLALGELKIQAELNLGAIDTETSIAQNCAYKKLYYTNYAIAITDETYREMFKTLLEYIVSCLDGTLTETGLSTVERNIYMHCQGGCDRTGTLSFLLLGLLGVSESDLAKEYELSSFSDIGIGRLRTTTKAVDTYDYVGMVEALKGYSGNTITDKFYNFAITCGVTAETITKFRDLMLE